MKGKIAVALVILVTIGTLILAWLLLQYVILEFDLDSALSNNNDSIAIIKNTVHSGSLDI